MSISSRLEKIENQMILKPMIVRYRDQAGQIRTGTVDDLERYGAEYLGAVSGGSIAEGLKILDFLAPGGSVIS